MQFDCQEGGKCKKIVRRKDVKEGNVSFCKYEEFVCIPECSSQSNEPVQHNLVTLEGNLRENRRNERGFTEDGIVQKHTSLYKEVRSTGTERMRVENLSHLQTLNGYAETYQ